MLCDQRKRPSFLSGADRAFAEKAKILKSNATVAREFFDLLTDCEYGMNVAAHYRNEKGMISKCIIRLLRRY